MKTAMQELINKLEIFKGMCKTPGEKFIINYSINNGKKLLEKEKEQIKDSWNKGQKEMNNSFSNDYYKEKTFEQYFEETFKN